MDQENLQGVDHAANKINIDDQMSISDDLICNKDDNISKNSGLAATIVAYVVIGILVLNLCSVLIYSFCVNPVTKLKLNMMLFDNYQINISAVTHYYYSDFYANNYERTIHHDILKMQVNGNVYALIEKEDYHPNLYDYYTVDGDILYQYVYTGYSWEKVECKDDSVAVPNDEGDENFLAILLDSSNFSMVLDKPGVWRANYDIVQDYRNLEVKYKKGQYIYSWGDDSSINGSTRFYLVFDSFGKSHIDLPWENN